MNRLVCGTLLLLATSVLAQQQDPPQYPPYPTPPTFPDDRGARKQMPPDIKAPSQELSPTEVQEQIQKKLDTEAALSTVVVKATVNHNSVMLKGTVQDERQHDLALRIAKSYAGEREIVDKIEVRGRT
jgi:BON domain